MPIGERNLSPGFIQLRTPAPINICSVTQQPPSAKLNTMYYRRALQTTRQSDAIRRGTKSVSGAITAGSREHQNRHRSIFKQFLLIFGNFTMQMLITFLILTLKIKLFLRFNICVDLPSKHFFRFAPVME